jgi:hypothetical protein
LEAGGDGLAADVEGLVEGAEGLVDGAEGLVEPTLGRGLIFVPVVSREFSVGLC